MLRERPLITSDTNIGQQKPLIYVSQKTYKPEVLEIATSQVHLDRFESQK